VFRLQDISIQRKLHLIIMISCTVGLLLVSGGFVAYEVITFRQTMQANLVTLANIVGNEGANALASEDKDRAGTILAALAGEKHIIAAALYDSSGRLFAEYPMRKANPGVFPQWPEPAGVRFEKDHLILFQEIRPKADEPAGTLFLKADLQELNERFERYGVIIVLFILTSSVATFFLASRLQRIISRPISHLAETAKAVSQNKNYSLRAARHGGDELGQLIDAFNEMLSEIHKRDGALNEAKDEMEKRVWARTSDLQGEISERKRAEEALKQQFARISLLNQITQSISERQDTESILHVVLRQLEDHMSVDLGSVAMFDAAAATLNVAALRLKNPLLASRLDLHEGTVLKLEETSFQLCKEGQTIYVPDTLKQLAALTERFASAGLRSAVAVPLMVDNRLLGVLFAARLKTDGFSSGDCEFLRMLSEHVALAAHQAGLHSELERAYNELRQTQQTVMQQERLKALGQMASGIAHDVNNALSPVVGFADLMLRGENGLSDNGKKYLKHIMTAGEDIAHIVARLREFYRRRDDREPLQALNFNRLVEQVVDMTRPRWRDIPQSRGVTVEMQTELDPDVHELAGIESEVREAMTNLVLNAVDALPHGGRITMRTRVARCETSAHGEKQTRPLNVVLEVSDNGVGMNEETRKRCLEPFFSTKGKRGTGLGLAMVYGVVERHEGTIEIQSEPGKGTTFRLIFPIRKVNRASTDVQEDNAALKPLQILCIDDEPLLRELLKELLERDGHKVKVSDGGQSGLDAFRLACKEGHPFDVVVTDLGMPYVDGRQVAKVLKQESPATPVLMLTGWGAFMKEDNALPSQVDGVLSKPPRSREIRETLRRVVYERSGVGKNAPAA
jgi:signal transduction histidine kinase/ActR/RegA family two-component response regulator